jgi:hypothetical protein
LPHEALLREHEGNQVVDFFFAQQNTVDSPHLVAEAFNHISVWFEDGLPEIFYSG